MSDVMWVFEKGDWVSYALAFVSIALWTAICLRALALRGSDTLSSKILPSSSTPLAYFMRKSLSLKEAPGRLEPLFIRTKKQLYCFQGIIKTLVAVAPLLGLLGTVIGMVEMFGSMEGSFGSQDENTIAGGISTALVTTQLGLVITAPGLIASYLLTRMQVRREQDLKTAMASVQGSST